MGCRSASSSMCSVTPCLRSSLTCNSGARMSCRGREGAGRGLLADGAKVHEWSGTSTDGGWRGVPCRALGKVGTGNQAAHQAATDGRSEAQQSSGSINQTARHPTVQRPCSNARCGDGSWRGRRCGIPKSPQTQHCLRPSFPACLSDTMPPIRCLTFVTRSRINTL